MLHIYCLLQSCRWQLKSIIKIAVSFSSSDQLHIALRELHPYTYKELSLWVCLWVRHQCHLTRFPLFSSICLGINALYWPNNINNRLIVTQYRQVPTIAGLYCPSTQLHHLLTHSQMDLVYKNVWKSSKLHGYTFLRYYLLIEYFFNEPLEYFFEIGWNVSHCEVVRRLATFWEKPIMIGWQGGISSNPFHHHVKGSTKK